MTTAHELFQLEQYDNVQPSSGIQPTDAPAVPPPGEQQQAPLAENVTPQPAAEEASVRREEKVEYRDQDGNLLNEEQVAALAGKVDFHTRYETRTRMIDADGNEIPDSSAGTAPPHPADREPETAVHDPENDGKELPATASPEDDLAKEKSVQKNDGGKPKPASEGSEATSATK